MRRQKAQAQAAYVRGAAVLQVIHVQQLLVGL